jgi:hypothetical protein
MQSRKIELGDVFTIETEKGIACLQCVEIPLDIINQIELVKVFYRLQAEHPVNLNEAVRDNFFFIRFPLKAAFRRKIVLRIGNVKLRSDFQSPKFYRTENVFGKGWQIVNSQTWTRENVNELSADQRKLSPWGMMNDTKIIELLDEGWTLDNWKLEEDASR